MNFPTQRLSWFGHSSDWPRVIRYLLVANALAVVTMIVGCSEPAPEELLKSAKEHLTKHDPQAAIIDLRGALQQSPDLAMGRLLLGQAFFEAGDPASAEIETRKALELGVAEDEALPLLARALIAKGQPNLVTVQYANTTLKQPAAEADFKTSLAAAFARQGGVQDAEAAVAAALKAVPDYPPALLVRAKLMSDAGSFDAAQALLDTIIAASPANYEALYFKGLVLQHHKKDVSGALEFYRKAIAERPGFLPAQSRIVEILLARKDVAGARAQVEAVRKVLPNHLETRFLEAQVALENQDYRTVREVGQLLVRSAPKDARSLMLAGLGEFHGGSSLQAEKYFIQVLQLAPRAVDARRMLAQVHLRNHSPAAALTVLAPLIESDKPDAQALSIAAQAQMQAGNSKRALSLFAQAAKLNPNDARSQTALAMSEFGEGRPDLGFSKLQKIAAASTDTSADLALVSGYYRQGRFEEALRALEKLEAKEPRNAFIQELRGRISLGRNDLPAARGAFEKALSIDPAYFPAAADLANLDLAEKKPAEARRRFEQVIAADPRNASARIALSQLDARTGASSEDVLGHLKAAVQANPTDVVSRLLLIDRFIKSKDYSAATSEAQEAVALRPDSPEFLDALGRVQGLSGAHQLAITTYSKLAAMQPKSPVPHLRLADIHGVLKDTKARRLDLQRALALAPRLFTTRYRLIQLELESGRPADAMALAKAAQRTPGLEAGGSLLVGDLAAGKNDWRAAIEAYRLGLSKGGGNALAMKLSSALVASTQTAEAEKFVDQWMKDHPRDADFRQYSADQALAVGDYALAASRYESVLVLKANNPGALNSLAWVTHRMKKPGAMAYVERALKMAPDHPSYLDTKAEILADENKLAEATALERRALELQPDNPIFRLNLAKLYLRAGDKAQAKGELEQLAKLGHKFQGHDEVARLLKTL